MSNRKVVPIAPKAKSDEWMVGLLRTPSGAIQGSHANACHALRESPGLRLRLAYDAFAGKVMLMQAPPWTFDPATFEAREWTSQDDLMLTEHLQLLGIPIKPITATQAADQIAREHEFHPVRNYFDGLQHDGEFRIRNWLSKYVGAEESPYTESVGRAILIGAVARIRRPGCKLDTLPIFEGPQGIGKSKFIRAIFDPWFTDEIEDFGSKDAAIQMRGIWGIEVSELDALSKAEVSRQKAFIARSIDRYRPPYERRVIEQPRSCVFWGTTNVDEYLKDETGARRFWPIRVGKIDLAGLEEARDQLWAEADWLFQSGAPWWLLNPEAKSIAEEQQAARYQRDPWDELIGRHLETCAAVSVEEILRNVLNIEVGRQTQAERLRVVRCLKARGWLRHQKRTGDRQVWMYRKPEK